MSPNTCLPVTEPNTLAGDGAEISHLQRGCRGMSRRDAQKTLPATQGLLPPSRGDFQGTWIRVHSKGPASGCGAEIEYFFRFFEPGCNLVRILTKRKGGTHMFELLV